MATVLQLVPSDAKTAGGARVERFGGPEDWNLVVRERHGERTVRRQGQELIIDGGAGIGAGASRVILQARPDVATEHAAIARADAAIRATFPRVRLYEPERGRVFLVLTLTWVAMFALGWLVCRRWRLIDRAMWTTVHLVWVAGASWLLFVHL
jgi:hypothetical protein